MVMILQAMNPEFDHVQILTSEEVPSKENLITRLLHVPSLKNRKFQENVESSAMVSSRGKGIVALEEGVVVEAILNAHILKEWATLKRSVIHYMAFLTRQPIFQNLKVLSQSFVMKNIENIYG